MVPIHASLGLANFLLAVATAVTGLTQKALKDLKLDAQKWVIFTYCLSF